MPSEMTRVSAMTSGISSIAGWSAGVPAVLQDTSSIPLMIKPSTDNFTFMLLFGKTSDWLLFR
jgi:hypothetical protein